MMTIRRTVVKFLGNITRNVGLENLTPRRHNEENRNECQQQVNNLTRLKNGCENNDREGWQRKNNYQLQQKIASWREP